MTEERQSACPAWEKGKVQLGTFAVPPWIGEFLMEKVSLELGGELLLSLKVLKK